MAIARTLLGGLVKATTRGGISEEQLEQLEAQHEAFLKKIGHKKTKGEESLRGFRPEQGGLGNFIRKNLGYSQEDIEPQGPAEEVLQGAIGAIPGYLMGRAGGAKESIGRAATRIGAGQVASTALKGAGAPEWAQGLGHIAGEGLGAHANDRYRQFKANKETGKKFEPTKQHGHDLYDDAIKSLSNDKRKERGLDVERGTARSVESFLKRVKNLWKTESDKGAIDKAEKIADTIAANIDSKGNIDIENCWENVKSIGRQYRDKRTTESEKVYIREAQDALKQVLKDHSAINPKFGEKLEDANSFHTYRKTNNIIRERLNDPGWFLKKARYTGIPQALDLLETVGRTALNRPARNYYKKMGEAILNDQKSDARRYAIQFNNAFERQQSKEAENDPEKLSVDEFFK
jgi:hypothetical protein